MLSRFGVQAPAAPLALLLVGCFSDPGLVGGDATGATTSDTSTAATSTSTSTSTSAASTSTSTTSAPETTDGTTAAITTGTTSSTSTTTTTTTTTDPGTGTTGTTGTTGEKPAEDLLHVDPPACTKPLWCHDIGDLNNGVPGRVTSAECFTSTLPAPLALTEVRYWIAANLGALEAANAFLRVYEFDGDAGLPGAILREEALSPLELAVGAHVRPLDPPLMLSAPSFCVGLIGGSVDTKTSIGVAAIDGDPDPQTTFIKLSSAIPACTFPSWVDLSAANNVIPNGPWCVGAHVAAL